jgi:hypothetical protein
MKPDHLTGLFVLIGLLAGLKIVVDKWAFDKGREKRRTYYRDTYLSSDEWKPKRALVLKRDHYRACFVARVPRRCTTMETEAAKSPKLKLAGRTRRTNRGRADRGEVE